MTKEDWSDNWKKFKHGDTEAFRLIYDFFFDRLYHYGRKLTSQTDLLEDCIQELFLTLYTNRKNLSDTDQLEFYLLKALKHTIYGKLRQEQRMLRFREQAGMNFELEFLAETGPDREIADRLEPVRKYLETLTPRSRELLYLKFYTRLDYRQIGEMLGIQASSVKKQVYRIMSRMKEELAG
ncbi:MAG: RNA polymerase sigma factor [Mangrovibacterium sp.]